MRLNAKDMERRKCRTYEDLLFNKNAGILGTVGKLRVTGDGCIPCGATPLSLREQLLLSSTSLESWEALSCKIDLLQVIRLFHGSLL